jgi:DME family drug/metabolite transporter
VARGGDDRSTDAHSPASGGDAAMTVPGPAVAPTGRRLLTVPGSLLVLTAATLWGTVGPAQVLADSDLSPAALGGWRLLLGALALLVPVAVHRAGLAGMVRLARRPPVLVAAAATGIYQVLFLYAVATTGAGLATAVALGTAPAATGLCSKLWLAERLGRAWFLSAALCICGCALVLGRPSSLQSPAHGLGLLAAIGAGACYGLYTVAAKDVSRTSEDLGAVAGVTLLLGALPVLPWTLSSTPELGRPDTLLLVLWLGLVTTGAAYWCFMRGITTTSAAAAGTLSLAEPVAAVALSLLVLREPVTTAQGLGMALVLLGLAVVSVSARGEASRRRPGRWRRARPRPA